MAEIAVSLAQTAEPASVPVLHQYGLSERVTRAVALACRGYECKEIAAQMNLSESSIKKKLRAAAQRLNARGRGHLCALFAMLACGIDRDQAEQLLQRAAD